MICAICLVYHNFFCYVTTGAGIMGKDEKSVMEL